MRNSIVYILNKNMPKSLYDYYCSVPSDINEHLPTLKELASKCKHVTEMWVREALSSVALLEGCDNVVSYDIALSDWVKYLKEIEDRRDFRIGDTLEINIDRTDMLFIDTWHCYDQLIAELNRHAVMVDKYIVMHDTTSFWEKWEIWAWYPCVKEKYDWLNKAINEFLENNKDWKILKVFDNNNGLTVLKRVSEPVVTVFTEIFGNYDTLKLQPEQTIDVRFVCFTDTDDLPIERWAEKQWEVRKCNRNKDINPRLWAKWHRTHPFEDFDGVVMRMDGTARLKKWDSVEFFVNQLWDNDILAFRHPERDCILQEAMFISDWWDERWRKYKWLPILEQANSYIDDWHPLWYGLSATWLLVYNKSDKLINFLDKRWEENLKWTYQDQLSFEPMVYKYWIVRKWVDIEWDIRNNPYITFLEWHLRDD